jgi:hypothetical protein
MVMCRSVSYNIIKEISWERIIPVHFFEDQDKTIGFVVQKESADQVEVAFVAVGGRLSPGSSEEAVRVGVEAGAEAAEEVAVEGADEGQIGVEEMVARLVKGHRPLLIWIPDH